MTIREAGTFGVAIAGGRASVERLDSPHPRSVAEFHLIGDAVTIAEVLAGVNHRIGRFFGPIRARGRKRRLKELRPLTAGTISLEDAARSGARLDPGSSTASSGTPSIRHGRAAPTSRSLRRSPATSRRPGI